MFWFSYLYLHDLGEKPGGGAMASAAPCTGEGMGLQRGGRNGAHGRGALAGRQAPSVGPSPSRNPGFSPPATGPRGPRGGTRSPGPPSPLPTALPGRHGEGEREAALGIHGRAG